MDESNCRPMSGQDCFVSSPLPYAKTIPLTMITGSPRRMSRETQAGERVGWVASPSTLNAATPPSLAGGVFMVGALYCEWTGPQNGASTQRVPFDSSQVESAPQLPMSWKSTSSLQK